MVTNHAPQMKYCRNIIAESRNFTPPFTVNRSPFTIFTAAP